MMDSSYTILEVQPLTRLTYFNAKTTTSEAGEVVSQEFDLSQYGIFSLLHLNINGANYFPGNGYIYDKDTGRLVVNGFNIHSTDRVSILFNKVISESKSFMVSIVELNLTNNPPIEFGSFETSSMEYYEEIQLEPLPNFYSFIGAANNGIFHAHPESVIFEKDTNKLIIKGSPVEIADKLVVYYNRVR